MSGAHAGSGDSIPRVMPIKEKCANETGSSMTLNCGKGVNHGVAVACTSIFLVLRSFTVENQLAVLPRTRSL